MPICKKCKSNFPNRVKIEGKFRILSKRKYCLKCSPFGKHNTREPITLTSDGFSICEICNKSYIYDRKKGHRRKKCNTCCMKIRKIVVKKRLVDYKGGKCIKCDYNRCLDALEFHHKNKKEKERQISGNYNLSFKKLKKEVDKCDLLCSNCHKEEEAKEQLLISHSVVIP